MAQNREKDETIELKVPSDSPLSLSCPDTTTISGCGSVGAGLDSGRVDRGDEPARPRSDEPTPDPARIFKQRNTETGVEVEKKTVKRCSGCRKRVGLTGFRCRCGDLFCAVHRYSDRHDCSFDYKTAGREAIARENPVVRAAKILKV